MSRVISIWTGSSSTTMIRCGSLFAGFGSVVHFSSIVSDVSFSGMLTLNVLPSPILLSTEIFPFSKVTSPFVMERPSPKPSGQISTAALSNGENMRFKVSSLMPIPVSLTVTVRISFLNMAKNPIEPDSVNFMALDSRLPIICSMRSASPVTVMSVPIKSPDSIIPLSLAMRPYSFSMSERKVFKRNGISFRVSLASFKRDRSRRLFTSRMICPVELRMLFR